MAHTVDARSSVFNEVIGNQYNVYVSEHNPDISAMEVIQKKLKYAGMDASNRSECLPGTRQDIRDRITSWAMEPSDKKILWIHGVAGSGKSTLATTVANFFREGECEGVRLGAFLFFNRDVPERSHPGIVIPTLAHQLGLYNKQIGYAIATAINTTPNICASSLRFQFRQLLVGPLSVLDSPIVLVLDALDECGNAKERKSLLALLARESIKFPRIVRMIVTSRAEYDICSAFEFQPHVLAWELDITTQANTVDISSYIRHRMTDIRVANKYLQLASDWPGERTIRALSEQALGLFVWASTAMEFIDAHDPRKRLDDLLLHAEGTSKVEFTLDTLYKTALESVARWDDGDLAEDFRAILGVVLVARMPLSTDAIDRLMGISEDGRRSIHTISLLRCVLAQSPTVRVLHPTFADFLSNRERCQRDVWFIEITAHNTRLAILCLRRLDTVLTRNMCNLTISSDDLGSLPDDVAYACIFWIEHVRMVEDGAASVAARAYAFLRRHLLHWLEAMSILKRSRETVGLLYCLLNWFRRHWPTHADMFDFIYDAWRFVQAFAESIEHHPLLVYTSALPFTPVDSPIYMSYMDYTCYPHNLRNDELSWSPNLLVLSKHEGSVLSVSFSPDAARVVSGSHDKTIRVWNTSSGVEVLPPLRGHQDSISSVAFSPDGLRIVSSSRDRTLRVWDVTTGVEALPPLQGHHDWVNSASFSPDGMRIVSGSRDHTIRVWNSTSGQPLSAFLGHEASVTSVSYSPDGRRIVSGSHDCTIRVWDAVSGMEILPPLRGHKASVSSVCFSPTGDYILSGSYDKSMFMWKATSGVIIARPFKGHEKSVNSAVFSSDGRFLISGSDDRTIRLWDVTSGNLFRPPLRGHQDHILSLSFHSGQDMRIASGSADNTVRIWEVRDLDVLIPNPHMVYRSLRHYPNGIRVDSSMSCLLPPAHQDEILSVAFSPDGSCIASCSKDMTIRISDANSHFDFLPPILVDECVRLVMFSPDGNWVVSVSDRDTIHVWDKESRKQVPAPPIWRWRPWISSTANMKVIERTDKASGPVDAESDIFLSIIYQTIERHHHSIEHPDIFITPDGWINCAQDTTTSTRISKLPPMFSAQSVVFASCAGISAPISGPSVLAPCCVSEFSSIVIGTQNGQLIVLHFPKSVMKGTIETTAFVSMPRFLLVHDSWWSVFHGTISPMDSGPVLGTESFMESFATLLSQIPPMPIISQ